MKKHNYSIRVFITLVMFLIVAGCSSSSPSSGVTVQIDPGSPAPLGGTMILRATVVSTIDAPDVEVFFEISSGVTVRTGQLRQRVQLEAQVPKTFELHVQLTEPGEKRILAGANAFAPGEQRGGFDSVYLEVGAAKTEIRKESLTPIPVLPTQDSLPWSETEKLLTTPTPEPPTDSDNVTPTPVP